MYLQVFLFSVVVSYIIIAFFKWTQSIKWADNIPGRKDWFFYNLIFRVQGSSPEKRVDMLIENTLIYPRFCAFLFLNKVALHVNHPDLIKTVLNSPYCLEKSHEYRFAGWGLGLGTAPPDVWKVSRKHINPALGTKSLMTFIPIFNECSEDFVKKISKHLDGKAFNLFEYATLVTLDSICATSFGVKVNALEKNVQFNRHLEKMHSIVSIRTLNYHLSFDWIFRLTKLYQEDKFARSECVRFAKELIAERQKILAKEKENRENNNLNNNEEDDKTKPVIFLDHLLHTPRPDGTFFPENEIMDNVNTMISAGNETTALTVCHATLFMAIHQNVQDKVVAELKTIFPDKIDITYEKLCKLSYMDMVLKETLRHCPAVANLARKTEREIELDGIKIPPGTEIHMSPIGCHKGEWWGENPHTFDPDRFLPENIEKRPTYAWIAFSVGIRNCLGYKYAIMSLKIMLIHLLSNYKFTTNIKWEQVHAAIDVHCHINVPHLVSIEKRKFYD